MDDEAREIQVDIDDSVRKIQVEYLDKDERVVKDSVIEYSGVEGMDTTPYYIRNTGDHTFKEDGIRYIRLRGTNGNDCDSEWKVLSLNYVTGPVVRMDPSLEGDMYVSGLSEPGSRIIWSQDKSIGTSRVGNDGRYKISLPKEVTKNPPKLKFYDESNKEERRRIIDIHLTKRQKNNLDIDTIKIVKETEGFNGADLESVVRDAIENLYLEGRDTLTTEDLLDVVKETKGILTSLKDKISQIKSSLEKFDIIKPASRLDE